MFDQIAGDGFSMLVEGNEVVLDFPSQAGRDFETQPWTPEENALLTKFVEWSSKRGAS
jgi:hypothetical protein